MSPEAQRIAIAKACGYEPLKFSEIKRHEKHVFFHKHLPDYLTDLNACHEMEKVLTTAQWVSYERELYHVGRGVADPRRRMIHATAAQRAEAFLRTIGKWEENT